MQDLYLFIIGFIVTLIAGGAVYAVGQIDES
jgi:hypothetical protein